MEEIVMSSRTQKIIQLAQQNNSVSEQQNQNLSEDLRLDTKDAESVPSPDIFSETSYDGSYSQKLNTKDVESSPDIISETSCEGSDSQKGLEDKEIPIQSHVFYNPDNLPSTSGTSIFNPSLRQREFDSSSDDDSVKDPDFFPSNESEYESSEFEDFNKIEKPQKHNTEIPSTNHNINEAETQIQDLPMTENLAQPSTTTQDIQVEVEQVNKSNYKDKRVYCFFCNKDVLDFSRHLQTWHSHEIDVQRMLSFPSKSKERRAAIKYIKNQGNFIQNRSSSQIRPAKRPSANQVKSTKDYLPCKHCLGFYSRKYLYRHTKKCTKNAEAGQSTTRQTSQSDGHTALLIGLQHDDFLKKELFSKMRADDTNMVAKKDFLICNYGYSYLKGRRSKGNLDLVRQNIRRLAKLLQIARRRNKSINELMDLLRPCHFKLIIEGLNEIAGYDPETDTYKSPTLAMNFGTLLKKCCDLAYIHLVQIHNTDDKQKEVQVLKTLIESQWADEVSAQAGANLNAQKWNKTELVPLTSDLRKLKQGLEIITQEAYNTLKEDRTNESAYNKLKEALYSQIILINRRRPAEVAQLKVATYKSINLDVRAQSEFQNCLTETEKILLNTFSRIVIRGKRGRGVPVLLSPVMKRHFDILIDIRENFVSDNPYVFHTKGANFLDGTKILKKYVRKCGVVNVDSITATKLRKHLATVTQLLNFSDKDMEQLSRFMGHSLNTHCQFYRLPDDVYQTAKVSKLLLLMSQGGADQYKGKTLDQIEINLEPIEGDLQPFEDALDHEIDEPIEDQTVQTPAPTQNDRKKTKPKPKSRIIWTTQEKRIIAKHFADHIKKKQSPKKAEVDELIAAYPQLFKEKPWNLIKAVVYNIYKGNLKVW